MRAWYSGWLVEVLPLLVLIGHSISKGGGERERRDLYLR